LPLKKRTKSATFLAREQAQAVELAPQPLADGQHVLGTLHGALVAILGPTNDAETGKHQPHHRRRDGQGNEQFNQRETALADGQAAAHGAAL
jgi:hypothetical protein